MKRNFDMDLLRECAEKGEANALLDLGCCYLDGDGVEQDYNIAKELLQKAVEAGNHEGLYWLGMLYFEDNNPEVNHRFALDYFLLADKLCGDCSILIGNIYLQGKHGVSRDIISAKAWYEVALDRGDNDAYYWLAYVYSELNGIFYDIDKAFEMANKAKEYEVDMDVDGLIDMINKMKEKYGE